MLTISVTSLSSTSNSHYINILLYIILYYQRTLALKALISSSLKISDLAITGIRLTR